ncbi:hypothetical protein V1514DRAFT_330171 [Lipomyces japonicus]|uniref:uncharacterized protein n=1 Tax=Lipomyces japonicus TaxID=56871 RepID=UPI0034CF458C
MGKNTKFQKTMSDLKPNDDEPSTVIPIPVNTRSTRSSDAATSENEKSSVMSSKKRRREPSSSPADEPNHDEDDYTLKRQQTEESVPAVTEHADTNVGIESHEIQAGSISNDKQDDSHDAQDNHNDKDQTIVPDQREVHNHVQQQQQVRSVTDLDFTAENNAEPGNTNTIEPDQVLPSTDDVIKHGAITTDSAENKPSPSSPASLTKITKVEQSASTLETTSPEKIDNTSDGKNKPKDNTAPESSPSSNDKQDSYSLSTTTTTTTTTKTSTRTTTKTATAAANESITSSNKISNPFSSAATRIFGSGFEPVVFGSSSVFGNTGDGIKFLTEKDENNFKPFSSFSSNPFLNTSFTSSENNKNKENDDDRSKKNNDDEDEDGDNQPENDQFDQPYVQLEKPLEAKKIETGEEQETSIFTCRAKLYSLSPAQADLGWKERGTGVLRLNTRSDNEDDSNNNDKNNKTDNDDTDSTAKPNNNKNRSRIIMRSDGALRVILNLPLIKPVEVMAGMKSSLSSEKFARVSAWENGQPIQYAFRMANQSLATEFIEAVRNSIQG